MVATWAALEVSSARNTVMVMITSSTKRGGRPARSRLRSPRNFETPFASMALARVSPPPNSISSHSGAASEWVTEPTAPDGPTTTGPDRLAIRSSMNGSA